VETSICAVFIADHIAGRSTNSAGAAMRARFATAPLLPVLAGARSGGGAQAVPANGSPGLAGSCPTR
jgi:hypothetical protein